MKILVGVLLGVFYCQQSAHAADSESVILEYCAKSWEAYYYDTNLVDESVQNRDQHADGHCLVALGADALLGLTAATSNRLGFSVGLLSESLDLNFNYRELVVGYTAEVNGVAVHFNSSMDGYVKLYIGMKF